MKTLFHKLLGAGNLKSYDQDQSSLHPIVVHSLHEHQRRALIGWMANRMGQLLQIESCESGTLIYLSFSKVQMNEDKEKIEDYLLYLASCLFEWLEKRQDVYLRIKELQLLDKYHKCLLNFYEEVKEEILQYFPRKQAEFIDQSIEDEVWKVYRDVIYAATQKKFLLIRKSEVDPYREGSVICEATIKGRSDIPKARDLAKQKLMDIGTPASEMTSQLLVISEAITNILKHAIEGKLTIIKTETSLHVMVEDSGPGFPLKTLPYTTLMAGYSTKKSLGQGFTLMMKMAQQVVLSTTPGEGSNLIIIFQTKEGARENGRTSSNSTDGDDPKNLDHHQVV